MASTYSPSLRIELIGTGEQSGTWGDTTNTNLGSLVEQAITGYVSIAMVDADYTLSALNGSPDESRNAVVRMTSTGSLSTTRNVIIPNVEKTYIFKNDTTGGQSLVIKTSGGTGVTVINGGSTAVFCDGTNTYVASTYIPTLTAGALTLNSGTTGTGSFVKQTSPTITTPTINTPTISGGSISGITDLAVADGGTGASTADGARTNLGVAIGTDVQAYDAELAAIAGLATNGVIAKTGAGTAAARTVTGSTGITVTNGDGVSGNPTVAIDSTVATLTGVQTLTNKTLTSPTINGGAISGITDLAVADGGTGASTAAGARTNLGVAIGTDVQAYDAELAAISGLASNGLIAKTGAGTAAVRTVTAGTGISISNGDGVSGNPTVGIDSTVVTLSGTQTLTNKTLTSPTISSPSISSPSMSGTPTAPTAAAGTNTTQVATTAFVQTALQAVYPVGSVYINAASTTNPATLLGFGTWAEIGAGRVLVGQNAADAAFDVLGETGGSKDSAVVSHTHTYSTTTASSGAHTHSVTDPGHSHIITAQNGGFSTPYANVTLSGEYQTNKNTNAATTGISIDSGGAHTHTLSGTTDSTGSSGTNGNLQPYIVVKMWQRTA